MASNNEVRVDTRDVSIVPPTAESIAVPVMVGLPSNSFMLEHLSISSLVSISFHHTSTAYARVDPRGAKQALVLVI